MLLTIVDTKFPIEHERLPPPHPNPQLAKNPHKNPLNQDHPNSAPKTKQPSLHFLPVIAHLLNI